MDKDDLAKEVITETLEDKKKEIENKILLSQRAKIEAAKEKKEHDKHLAIVKNFNYLTGGHDMKFDEYEEYNKIMEDKKKDQNAQYSLIDYVKDLGYDTGDRQIKFDIDALEELEDMAAEDRRNLSPARRMKLKHMQKEVFVTFLRREHKDMLSKKEELFDEFFEFLMQGQVKNMVEYMNIKKQDLNKGDTLS